MMLREPHYDWTTTDFFYVRLRFRRSELRRGVVPGLNRNANLWEAWRHELVWVFDRLPSALKGSLLPVFATEELKQLLLALRFLAAGDVNEFKRMCRSSLLTSHLLDGMAAAGTLQKALSWLELQPGELRVYFRGSRSIYMSEGPGGLEQALQDRFLQLGQNASHDPAVRAYFGCLIDMRNLLGLYKHLRWQVARPASWLDGGRFSWKGAQKIWQQKDMSGLSQLARRLAGDLPAGADLEAQLWQGFGTKLQGLGRDPLQLGLVLDYLVRWQLLLRKQAVARS